MTLRKTKVICTLGPAVDDEELIRKLIRAGMDAARFNFSHGDHEEHLQRLNKLNNVRDAMSRPVATILDTKGPEIRIKSFDTKSITLEAGASFTLTTREAAGNAGLVGRRRAMPGWSPSPTPISTRRWAPARRSSLTTAWWP